MIKTRFVLCLLLAASAVVADTNRVVLRINDHILTLHDYRTRYSERLRSLQRAQMPEAERSGHLASLGESVFREMFDELLMLSRASHLGLEVTEEMVEDAMQRMREANGLDDVERFEAALAQAGLTRADLRRQARRNLILRHVTARELQSRVELEEEDLRRYYQGHLEEFAVPRRMQLRSIVVLDSSGLDEAARMALAAEAATVLEMGVDLETWAKTHSEAGETTDSIDLGWVEKGDLASELEPVVWSLEAGDVSPAIPGRGGLHVVQVVAAEDAHVKPFVDVKDQVYGLEISRLQQDAVTKMLTEFEEASYVRIDPPPEAAGFRTTRAGVSDALGELQGVAGSGASLE